MKHFINYVNLGRQCQIILPLIILLFSFLNVSAQAHFDFDFSFNKYQLFNGERLTMTPKINHAKSPMGAVFVKVKYYWDGNLICTRDQSPFDLSYQLENQSVGKHILKVAVYATGVNLPDYGPFNFEYPITITETLNNNSDVVADQLVEKASQGDAEAMFQLAMCYRRGNGVVVDNKECVAWLKRAAAHNHTEAQYYLAGYYEIGEGGLPVDSVMAYKYYTLAAEKKDLFSMLELGESYLTFKGVPNAKQECLMWLKKISQGDFVSEFSDVSIEVSCAEFLLYCLYQGNDGIEKNIPLSISYLKKSVDHGERSIGEALNAMGECYLEGNGVEKNEEEAMKWFKKSADKMCGLGSGNLGAIYYNRGMFNEAFKYLKEACVNNSWPSPKAMRLLSACYKYGRGTSVDGELGEYWMQEAVKHKEPNAMELMKLNR